ncbi:hypothetical protein DFJ74DRAFT_727962 [Hyaloraphidium curvatum]|nr:hypothetical protein DFJ74DRAFT_727962 [Hyaloraphidium curvatum]
MVRRFIPVIATSTLLCFRLLLPKSGPPPPAGSEAAERPCFIFADPLGTYMFSSQLLSMTRIIGLARTLNCLVLPMFLSLGPHALGWDNGTIPLDAYYSTRGAFVDFSDGEQVAQLSRAVAEARGDDTSSIAEIRLPADRTILLLHQYRNAKPLSLPCLLGSHSHGDARVTGRQQPFLCKELVVLQKWATHPGPRPSAELARFRGSLAGKLVAIPQPFMLDLECALEMAGSDEVPPRIELLKAAKWLLWNGLLSPDVGSLASAADGKAATAALLSKLATTREIPALDSPLYASYPVPNPILVAAHVRSSPNHVQFCSYRMRFPLCATNDELAARSLVDLARSTAGPNAIFLAGDKLVGIPGWGTSTVVQDAFAAIPAAERPPIFFARAFADLYRAVLSHRALNFTDHSHLVARHGAAAEKVHWEIVAIVMDQILLGCGDLLGGGLHQTYWSTFSMRSRATGQTVGRLVCLPAGSLPQRRDATVTRAELKAEEAQLSAAGVDFEMDHEYKGSHRRTLGREEWAMGCMRKGRFLPSLTFAERLDSKETCDFCGGTGRW